MELVDFRLTISVKFDIMGILGEKCIVLNNI